MKSDPLVMSALQERVPFVSTPHKPLEDVRVIVPGTDPDEGRKVAQVCCQARMKLLVNYVVMVIAPTCDQVPFDKMQPTLSPAEVYT